MDDRQTANESEAGLDRRALLRRGAVVAGALVWTTPVVQTIAQPAFAVGSEPPGPAELCAAGTKYAFRHIQAGANAGLVGRLHPTTSDYCIIDSNAPVTRDAELVEVVYSKAEPLGAALATRATITLAPGYRMTKLQGRSRNQGDPEFAADGSCPAPASLAPVSEATCATLGLTYVVDSTFRNTNGALINLRWVSGEIECVGCS